MTAMNNSNMSRIIFCGVVAGYNNENNLLPSKAAEEVGKQTAAHVLPAVCVYHTDWGCPVGGEPVGAFVLAEESAIMEAETMRKALSQSTLSVCLRTADGGGRETIGFSTTICGELLHIGKLWQEIAAKKMQDTGIYVSCGIADNGDGKLTISAEANPEFVSSTEMWMRVVESICEKLGCIPEFERVYFNYLK